MQMGKKRTTVRFNIIDDIVLLKEVIAHNPFEDLSRWDVLHESVVKATGNYIYFSIINYFIYNNVI